jgi:hypothetical protein
MKFGPIYVRLPPTLRTVKPMTSRHCLNTSSAYLARTRFGHQNCSLQIHLRTRKLEYNKQSTEDKANSELGSGTSFLGKFEVSMGREYGIVSSIIGPYSKREMLTCGLRIRHLPGAVLFACVLSGVHDPLYAKLSSSPASPFHMSTKRNFDAISPGCPQRHARPHCAGRGPSPLLSPRAHAPDYSF